MSCEFCDGCCSCHIKAPCSYCVTHVECEECGETLCEDRAMKEGDRMLCPECALLEALG